MDYRSNIFSKWYDSNIIAHFQSKFLRLVNNSSNKCNKNSLCLITLYQIYTFLCGRCRSNNNSYTRNITGYKRYTKFTDYGIRKVSVARSFIRNCSVNIFQNFDKFCAESSRPC